MPDSKPTPEAGGADPSMEDILASIRRILNEDEAATPAPAPALPVSSPKAPEDDGPLELTEEMMVTPPAPEPPAPEPPPDPAPPPVAAAPPPEPPPPPPPAPAPVAAEGLLGEPATVAAAAAMGSLMRAVASDRGAYVTRGGPTIEDVVREELRPLLKQWLDDNLPSLVERLVRAEIERVVARSLG